MKIIVFTLAYEAMPFITMIYPELRKLPFDWTWWVMEGVALPEKCTSWCAHLNGGVSKDGTLCYLRDLAAFDPRVKLESRWNWHGKVEMCNYPLEQEKEPALLWQIDSDELWTQGDIEIVRKLFLKYPDRNCAYFWCRYFVGPDIVITSRDTYGNHSSYEWLRVWRWKPGQKFASHEPPVLTGATPVPFTHSETSALGLVFDHYAYATEKQVAFKEFYYGSANNRNGHLYRGAVENWKKLQRNTEWPVTDLKRFLPWVGDNVVADLI